MGMMGTVFLQWRGAFGGPWLLLIPLGVLAVVGILVRAAARRDHGHREGRKAGRSLVQDQILKLASRMDGLITVTEVVAETGLPFKKAERTLDRMVDFSRVNMTVSDAGVVFYEFVELQSKHRADAKSLRETGV